MGGSNFKNRLNLKLLHLIYKVRTVDPNPTEKKSKANPNPEYRVGLMGGWVGSEIAIPTPLISGVRPHIGLTITCMDCGEENFHFMRAVLEAYDHQTCNPPYSICFLI